MPDNPHQGVLRPRAQVNEEAPYWKQNVTNTINEELGEEINIPFWQTTEEIYGNVNFERGQLCSGLIYGSVQSGKTFSMLGVSALGLDDNVDIVVILGGSKSALRQQTHTRVIEQLARTKSRSDYLQHKHRRFLSPSWNTNRLERWRYVQLVALF